MLSIKTVSFQRAEKKRFCAAVWTFVELSLGTRRMIAENEYTCTKSYDLYGPARASGQNVNTTLMKAGVFDHI